MQLLSVRKIWIKIAGSCLHSKKICRFDENYGVISVFDLVLLRLKKKMFLKKFSSTHLLV